MVFQCDVHANVECITQRGLVYTSQYSHHVYISLILSPWRATGIWLLLIQLLASIALSSPLHHVSLDVPVSISLSCYNMQHRTQHSWGVSCKMQLEKNTCIGQGIECQVWPTAYTHMLTRVTQSQVWVSHALHHYESPMLFKVKNSTLTHTRPSHGWKHTSPCVTQELHLTTLKFLNCTFWHWWSSQPQDIFT